MRTLPIPTLNPAPQLALFPPLDCPVCTLFSALKGMEINKALNIMRTAFHAVCECGMALGAHGVEHPHKMPLLNCYGIQKREV